LKERQEVIELFASSATIEKYTTSFEDICNQADPEEIIGHVKRIGTTWNWGTSYETTN
jgi:hypothetical protein